MFNWVKRFFKFQERALQVSDVSARFYESIGDNIDYMYDYVYILNHFIDSEGSYLVFTANGRLFRVRYTSDGVDVTFAAPVEVVMEFTEVTRSVRFHRNKENKLCFYAIAASSVLNRVGEIDSTDLFDSFVETFDEPQPLNFYHIQKEQYRMGEIVGIAREGDLLIIWGYIDETTPLGKYAEKRFKKGDYGISIEFYSHKQDVLRVSDVEIPVHTNGIFVGAAVLQEKDAASYMTIIEAA